MATTEVGTTTICGRFQATAAEHAGAPALRTRGGEIAWNWGEYAARVREAAGALHALGLRRGDTMACWLTNRPEFHVADAGAMHLGVASFSVYQTFTVEQAEHVIGDAGSRVLVTEAAFLERALAVRENGRTAVEHVIVVDSDAPEALGWDELLDGAGREGDDTGFDFEATWRAVTGDDLATLIYTSGTTGPPKGVELTHANVIAEVETLDRRLGFPPGARAVSFLPMAHIAERMCTHYFPMLAAFDVTCCPVPAEVAGYLPEVRPGFFFSPPRLWEKLRAAVLGQADDATRAELDAAVERVLAGEGPQDGPLQQAIRAKLGFDALEVGIVGAAPCPGEVIAFFHALGVPLSEIYGMSETTGAATIAAMDQVRIGTVGPALDGCEVKLGEGGEVLMRGPMIMRGYRNLPERTAEAIDPDGWLHSGDVGRFDDDGHLRIVDRIKELIINAAGKNMSPANIEATLKSAGPLIGQACVIGDRRPYNVALLVLDPDTAGGLDPRDPAVVARVQAEVDAANEKLARVEQIKRFAILREEWIPGGDELTPTMKLKRRPVAEKYAAEIEALYGS
jgi:long-subunit acyl-CoA synthetase (AMP-forming)